MDRATLTYTDGMAFNVNVDGHEFMVDASPEHGGRNAGPKPKPLLLASLAGCTAMDVISILNKMRQVPTRFEVYAEAELGDEHPKTYQGMTVVFEVEGDVDKSRLSRAVALSRDRYCGVNAMLNAYGPVAVKVILNGEEQPEPPAV